MNDDTPLVVFKLGRCVAGYTWEVELHNQDGITVLAQLYFKVGVERARAVAELLSETYGADFEDNTPRPMMVTVANELAVQRVKKNGGRPIVEARRSPDNLVYDVVLLDDAGETILQRFENASPDKARNQAEEAARNYNASFEDNTGEAVGFGDWLIAEIKERRAKGTL